ncbi:UNVERIFIED_ORG: capsid and scaffold protein [Salmonella phage PSP2-22]
MGTTGKGLPRSLKDAKLNIPMATTSDVGGVKKSATVASPAAITAAAGTQSVADPTKAEFDALVAEYNKLRTDVTALRTP